MKKLILIISAATIFAMVSGCTTYYAGPPPSRSYPSHRYNNRPATVFVRVSRPDYLVLVPGLSVYFVPNVSAEIFFYGERWYYRLGAKWYWGSSYRGPWTYEEVRIIPRSLRQLPRDYRTRYRSKYYRVPYGHWKKRQQEPPLRAHYRQPPYMYRVPNLNIYIIPGISAEIVFYNGRWYNRHQGVWYSGSSYSGPWRYIKESKVPRKLWDLGPDYRKDVRRYKRVPYGAWKKPGERGQKPRVGRKTPHREGRPVAIPRKSYGKTEPRVSERTPPVVLAPRGEEPRARAEKKPFLERKAELRRKRLPAQPETPSVQLPPETRRKPVKQRPAKQKPGKNRIVKKRGTPATLPVFDINRPARVRYMARKKVYYIPGISRDILYFKGSWYLRNRGAWYLGGSFRGPWNLIRGKKIPGALMSLPNDFRERPFEDVPYGHWKNGKEGTSLTQPLHG
ncbi:hypothetical protein BMS3Abin14_00218 [bacterium BMS3Abin14]|nr:hypothetical protein BMS3Abin14_00218 [bacterium BMS3Abin14]